VACRPLIAEQPAIRTRIALPRLTAPIPFPDHQAQPLGRRQPLAGDGAAVAEHHQAPKTSLPLHPLETQQGPEGLAGPRAGMHQHISSGRIALVQAHPQQLDQLPLPIPRLQRRLSSRGRSLATAKQFKGGRRHRQILDSDRPTPSSLPSGRRV
jgi:hypothetical protein